MNAVSQPESPATPHELHRFWWLYLPCLFFLLRYIVPICVLLVFLNAIGLLGKIF